VSKGTFRITVFFTGEGIFQGAPLRCALACGARKGIALSVTQHLRASMAQKLRHAGSTLRFAQGQAVLGYYLPPLPGLVFRWFDLRF
jgi:hypothetical protein